MTHPTVADTASIKQPSMTRLVAPRYWPAWLFVAWLRVTAALPWRFAIELHRVLGRLLWHLLPRRRDVVLRNLALCFPGLTTLERKALARRNFENVAISVAEIAIAWFAEGLPPVRIEGREHLDAALDSGRGAILYSGHFTTLEITARFVKDLVPRFAFMFRTRRNPVLDAMQTRGRRRTAEVSFSNGDSRAMLNALRANAAVWYAPDQAYDGRGAALLPFFGEPAMTNTATSRIARLSGSALVPFRFRRLDDGSGYVLHFDAPPAEVPTEDALADTRKLTVVLEAAVRECPEQYLWTTLPDAYATQRVARSTWRELLAAPLLILGVAAFIVAADNGPFWSAVWDASAGDEHRVAILASMLAILFGTVTITLAVALGNTLLKTVAAALLLIAAACGYFMTQYGAVIDQSMIRNAVETTALEATPLLGTAFFWHVVLYGALPAGLVVAIPIGRPRWRPAALARLGLVGASLAAIGGAVYANFAAVSFFGHEHHTVRLLMNPGYPLYAAATFGAAEEGPPALREPLPFERAGGSPRKPALVVVVMGETARADRFSLNGYERDTNRFTRKLDIVNFPRVLACGTSTADSVPCVFSGLGQAHFTHAAAATRESLFGALQRLGVDTFWRDNSTGCKDVCDEAHFEERASWTHPTLCDGTGCFDEILLEDFDALLEDRSRDHFIVLHQRGSHGPAYHTDAPAWIKAYAPECDLPNLRNCDRTAVNNAYDNTILYTDYFLSRVIGELERRSDDFDTAMLYVSDHGESLGENGLYLHGFPYAMAPREQKEVPMLFWASPGFYDARARTDRTCLRHTAQHGKSHDMIFHTLLPLFDVASPLYEQQLDLFASCRGPSLSANVGG
jgi:lipid A ethanolaminephosphotransferase